jgi:hypothetical protein
MKPLPSFGRNDVIRTIALISVVAFPLIADAQLGLRPKGVEISSHVSPVAGGPAKAAIISRDSCADQHWPYFSNGCLRGPADATAPRLVSMNVESSKNSVTTDDSVRVVGTTTGRGNVPVAKPKKNIKPRVATHRRERSNIGVNYAATSEVGHMSLAGW